MSNRYRVWIDPAEPPADLDQPDWPAACPHRPADARELGYLAWHDMAERRTRRGERQTLCKTCERWAWQRTPCPAKGG